jgi:hypothetical protein
MTERLRLPNRRSSLNFTFECNALRYRATVSYFADGRLAEIFIGNAKAGSHSDSAAKDSAVVCSIALQHGERVHAPVAVHGREKVQDNLGIEFAHRVDSMMRSSATIAVSLSARR